MIAHADIVEIVANVISTMLKFDVYEEGASGYVAKQDSLSGVLQISGEWNGTVAVSTCSQLARNATSRVFNMSLDAVQLEDEQDTIAELTNMIGGNIKSLLPGPSILSLPIVVSGKDLSIRMHGLSLIADLGFIVASSPMSVRIYRSDK